MLPKSQRQPADQFIYSLHDLFKSPPRVSKKMDFLTERCAKRFNHLFHSTDKSDFESTNGVLKMRLTLHYDLRRGRWRRSAQISDKIRDRVVRLMTDRRNDRDLRCGD